PLRRLPPATLFPYTTLFRSEHGDRSEAVVEQDVADAGVAPAQHRGTLLGGPVTVEPGERALHDGGAEVVAGGPLVPGPGGGHVRSEEHTSELQSRENLVCRL